MPTLAFIVSIISVVLVPILVTLIIIWWRFSYRKRQSVSPLTREMLRAPGTRLRSEIFSIQFDLSTSISAAFMSGLYPALVYFAHHYYFGTVSGFVAASMALFGVSLFGFSISRLFILVQRKERLKRGLECEMAVGIELDQLMKQGYSVFHDLPAEGFNIDHVVIGKNGVFAVETKGRSKKMSKDGKESKITMSGKVLEIGGWHDRVTLEQAERQAVWLSRWLSEAVGDRVQASPVVVFPGWYIDRKSSSPVPVLNEKEIVSWFRKLHGQALDAAMMKRVAYQVERRVRDISSDSVLTLPEHLK